MVSIKPYDNLVNEEIQQTGLLFNKTYDKAIFGLFNESAILEKKQLVKRDHSVSTV